MNGKTEEIWKEYKGLIKVSNLGNVKSLDRVQEQNNRWGKTMMVTHKGSILHPCKGNTGYYRIVINNGKNKEYKEIHRLVGLLFCEVPKELSDIPLSKLQVDHIDGDKTNNIWTNLRWTTPKQKWLKIVQSDEYRDKLKKAMSKRDWKPSEEQRRRSSEANKGKKLTEEQKRKISERMKELLKDPRNHPMYGKTGELSPNFGKHLSEEHRAKISAANKGKKMSEDTKLKLAKKVYQCTLQHKLVKIIIFIKVINGCMRKII